MTEAAGDGFARYMIEKGVVKEENMMTTAAEAALAVDRAHLPRDAKARKATPMATGLLDYFPLALAAVADLSRVGNDQHNPGEPLHWAREKSTDHADCIVRHLVDRGNFDVDGVRHAAKVAWRALALLQTELENAAIAEKALADRDTPAATPITEKWNNYLARGALPLAEIKGNDDYGYVVPRPLRGYEPWRDGPSRPWSDPITERLKR